MVVAIGMFGYAIWCLAQAIFDTDGDGSSLKGVAVRLSAFLGGLGYVALGVFALHRVLGTEMPTDRTRYWTAELLRQSWGPWLVGTVGFVLIGAGIAQFVYGQREGFRKYLNLGGASIKGRHWIVAFGKHGYSAQGVVLCIVGAFLINAAIESDAGKAGGLDAALRLLAEQSFGPWVLGVVAAGLTSYGIFMILQARYRRLA
jgi:hypothetical protein